MSRRAQDTQENFMGKKAITVSLLLLMLCISCISAEEVLEDKVSDIERIMEKGGKIDTKGFSIETKTNDSDKPKEDPDVTEEENAIEEFVKGKEYFLSENFPSALEMFTAAHGRISIIEDEKKRDCVRRSIGFFKAKTLFELGRFRDASNETMRLQTLNRPAIELLQKSMKYAELTEKPTEEGINEALKENGTIPSLLLIRANMRISNGLYKLASLDVNSLAQHTSHENVAERLKMHLCFLNGKYQEGIKLLKRQKDCSVLYQRALSITGKLNEIKLKKHTDANIFSRLKEILEIDLQVAMGLDTKFKPSIFSSIKKETINKIVDASLKVKKMQDAVKYSEMRIKSTSSPTEEEYCEHIKLLISVKKFQTAEILIKTKLSPDSQAYANIKTLYNVEAKKAREQQDIKAKEARESVERETEKAQKEKIEKEKRRAERRISYVKSKRGYSISDPEGFYKFLKLKKGTKSTEKEIMTAYRKTIRAANILKKDAHGDKKKADAAMDIIIKANKAKEVLTIPERKDEYDSGYYMLQSEMEAWGYNDDAMDQYEEQRRNPRHHQADHSDIFDILMGGGFGGFGGFSGSSGGRGRRVVYYM
ncbi:hypothetical protein NEFER03_0824 [Nematocida sp. LUAm3]|nr:hypothetical protein NEFER03_0824 [Nematocida sp. LUAm3]KAI5174842.1 hypothetical protein NEFER02_0942 [Nematocida sp. LUAm2]KAI5177560.1 hypothetical protein NEFER01_0810 [Nematocida sp. LUAm1]